MKKNHILYLFVLLLIFGPFSFAQATSGGGFFNSLGLIIFIFILIALALFFSGKKDILRSILEKLSGILGDGAQEEEEDENENDLIEFSYPAGASPTVFQSGWMFGAKCIADGVDVSDEIKWSGTATFHPSIGNRTRPTFSSVGGNTITISYKGDGAPLSKTISVNAVSSDDYAKVGDTAKCGSDAHGCHGCPHPVVGPITTGSSVVLIAERPAARQGDHGVHASCCGENKFNISGATGEVIINGRRAAKKGDETTHCGGVGKIDF